VKNTIAVVVILLLIMLPGAVFSQAQKIGFVNSAKIFDDLPEARDIVKRIQGLQKPVQDSLALIQKDIETRIADYQKKESMLNDQAKRAAAQEIQDLQVKGREYQQRKTEELTRQQDVLLAPLKEKIQKAIERVAKAENYKFVFDRTEQVQILLYADPKEDLTNRVLDNLKRGK
jgi:outer membrane protein